jgi:5'-nucleotidase
MKILITNDDGWQADGILALMEVAKSFGDCFLVGPADHQSGISHQITMHRPVALIEHQPQVFSVDGTPADCVRIGLTHLADKLGHSFDLVISGINNGGNLGSDVYVSGTVAGAREAAIFGVKAISLSQHRLRFKDKFDWTHSKTVARKVLEHCLAKTDLRPRQYLNANLPDFSDHASLPDFEVVDPCQLDPHPLPTGYIVETDADSHTQRLTYSGKYNDRKRDVGSDIEACFSGNVPVTTLQV